MPNTLFDLIQANQHALVDALVERLTSANAPHYQDLDPGILRLRCEKLVQGFLASMRGNPEPFVQFVGNIVQDRISEGFYLREVQLALTRLEERAWAIAVDRSNLATLVPNLGIITRTVGQAKDELARVYLARSQKADRAVVDLQTKLNELFKGTEGHVQAD